MHVFSFLVTFLSLKTNTALLFSIFLVPFRSLDSLLRKTFNLALAATGFKEWAYCAKRAVLDCVRWYRNPVIECIYQNRQKIERWVAFLEFLSFSKSTWHKQLVNAWQTIASRVAVTSYQSMFDQDDMNEGQCNWVIILEKSVTQL